MILQQMRIVLAIDLRDEQTQEQLRRDAGELRLTIEHEQRTIDDLRQRIEIIERQRARLESELRQARPGRRIQPSESLMNWSNADSSWENLAPLDGIIAHLTRQWGGSVHDFSVVVVATSSQPTDDRHAAKNAADLQNGYSSWRRLPNSGLGIFPNAKQLAVL